MRKHISREIRLKRRPIGMPAESDFELAEVELHEPSAGEILVRNLYMSVDPYMRGRMIERKSYIEPFEVGAVLSGGAVGEVMTSAHDRFLPGDHVLSMNGWREAYVSDGSEHQKIDGTIAPLSSYLGALGMPGLTAYVGLLDIGKPQPEQTVFVSGAAGAVGSLVCQIAKLKGCTVAGSAGTPEKREWLTEEAGVDVALNYKEVENLRRTLVEACPNGIDIYFDNVGGEHLEAALWRMNDHGSVIACGSISNYNATEPPPGPRNLFQVVTKRLLWKGFIVTDHYDRFPNFARDMGSWIADGNIKHPETLHDGIENASKAFMGLFKGDNLGKMLVRLTPDDS